jgi:uncharacterized protein (DUF3084 family)
VNREHLIERKESVRNEIARVRSQLARIRAAEITAVGGERHRTSHQIQELEARLDALVAEEHSLRLQIDRSR